ncbi:hypothetical protein [Paraburkholderia sediminicola]|uniref:hypothetical protein n=1 Tax=Paraburkholderia sediminicola TaxID=458836 RepID=UPI0038BDACB5
MTVRKYWQRHSIQMRVVAFMLLVLIPVTLPVMAAAVYWREILREYADQYRDAWRVLMRGI